MSWRYLKIEDFCSTGSGGTPSRSKPEYYEGGDIPWIKSGDLKDSKIYDANEYITAAGLENSSAKIVEKDSILIAMYGATVGRLAILGINAATNQAICNIRPDTTIADMKYLYYFLKSKFSYFVENAVGGAQPNISQGLIKSLEVPLPPLDEQKRIAAILDKADAIRQKREQAIKLADDFLRATFATMYGNPITNPKKWPVHLMGEIIEFKGGNQPPKSDFIFEPKQGYIRLVQIRDFKSDKYATYIPQEKAKRIFEVDDVMIARYGPPVFQILRGLSGSYNVALMKASPKENIRKGFIFYLLQLPEYHDVVVKNSERTAGQTGVNLELLNKFNVPLPPIYYQDEILARLARIEKFKEKIEISLNHLEMQFLSLQKRLMGF
ncbi:restriction endonuclease subunit S [Escherichia coli]|uniref:restriction endonuclease subunit S n=2 Tax=Escherichia coli TaxID=562 RepID=UPI000BE7C19B|nr:restriction endonuclease subunit S [Escherichia coli]EFB7611432.1 restriction endonuclease subunit S [Escherichia coli]EFJ3314736.1 restriction endonuclease subunit S [Escherichia coli]EFN7413604.1 restriction endonuclease subunit S [Escherichia coli]EFN9654949.1 restriction endonuclease subunit S [Escherichia coli]EFN9870979.1 restriction endonuclease subunit S [Escherichia coli]